MFNIASLKPLATRGLGRTGLVLQKYSPEILTTVGIVGVVAAGVMASRATLKLKPILDVKNDRLEIAKSRRDDDQPENDYTVENYNRDVAHTYIKTGLDIIKLYGPAVSLGIAGIVSIVSAHGILKRRNVALVAAVKAVESSFAEYRKKVAETIGDDAELDIHLNRHEEEFMDEETGKVGVRVVEHEGHSPYAKFFDPMSACWQKDANYNLMFLKTVQEQFNQQLQCTGHVFLNEVYKALDIPETPEGQAVGWVLGHGGDEHVDFGIYNVYDEQKRMFVNGHERSILLDFNVDGVIWDKI